MPPWYAACPRCTAKWFTSERESQCVRCGTSVVAAEQICPPWLKQSFVPSTSITSVERNDPMAKQPIHNIRFGYIKASIWQNQTKSGDRHNVTLTRLFRDGDVWRESNHFGRDDLLLLAKVIDLAHTWIVQNGMAVESASE
jgi:DNA-directed RNA polymerase subunit M/transcription elongation factor TFIIS